MGSRKSSQKDAKTFPLESQLGECESVWLISGPPFDQRDYMISPSESDSALVKDENVSAEKKEKKKLGPWDMKIDDKYLLDSQKALSKILDLVRDGSTKEFSTRMKGLVLKFVQGRPSGLLVDDLPIIIEIVEYFSRNRHVNPEFTNLVKMILCIAKEPPKVGKSSDILHCIKTLADYFTLLGELLATFEEENLQFLLLEIIDSLITRRKLVDMMCVKLSVCHEALEESQMPYVVASLLETVSPTLYIYYLELALQIILTSVKAGCIMLQSNVLEFALCRIDMNIEKNADEESLDVCEGEDTTTYDYYQILDKTGYLIWGLMSIANKQNVKIRNPSKEALGSLRRVFQHEFRKVSKKAVCTRNNLAGIIVKLYSFFGEGLPIVLSGLADDIAVFCVATEMGMQGFWTEKIKLGTSHEDYVLKELMLLCCCLFAKNEKSVEVLKSYNVMEGVLRLISPNVSSSWIPSQFINLFFIALRILPQLASLLPELYILSNGNKRLISAMKWCMEEHFDRDSLLECLKTFCLIITSGNKSIVEDANSQGGVEFMLDLCLYLLDIPQMKIGDQEKLSRIFVVLDVLLKNEKNLHCTHTESFTKISLKMLQRILADLKNDSKWSPILFLAFGSFLWEAVAWCKESLKAFMKEGGIFLLLDFIESALYPVQMLFLGILVDMTDEGETLAHLLTWRGKDGYGLLNMLIRIWCNEEHINKVHRSKDGLIIDVESPLMTEEQWFLTYQVENAHLYSPSIAEMMCSVRPKIHALYQFLKQRYFSLTQIGESYYKLQLESVQPSYQVYIPLVEHYFALKMGEVWFEVLRDVNITGVIPTSFDGEMLSTLIQEKIKWASRIKTIQEEILLRQGGSGIEEEKQLYNLIRSCQLTDLLDGLHELDYIARTSFHKFQKRRKQKQIKEVNDSLSAETKNFKEIHRTCLAKTNATVFCARYVRIESENKVSESKPVRPVSPVTNCENFPNFDDL